ncbi:aspartate aminotransferase family protein [Planctomycetota bacterium]
MNHILPLHPQLNITMEHGLGCALTDITGKTYLDCESGVWCTCLGHNHPAMNDVLKQQCDRLTHIGYRFRAEVIEKAALRLLDITGLTGGRCVFLTSGSETVHVAMRVAQVATKRNRWVVLDPSYLAAYGEGDCTQSQQWFVVDRDAEELDPDIAWDQVAGFVFEPGSSAGRVHFPATALVSRIVHQVREHGGLIIAEEVTTGMGRTGAWFGYNHYNIQPDIVAVGKGIGNGYPVSAVGVSPQVAQAVKKTGLHYVQSHQNDPLGCAVALAVLQTLQDENLIVRSQDLGRRLRDQLLALQKETSIIKDVRGRGLMVAVEFQPTTMAGEVFENLLTRGIIVGCNPDYNLIRFMPPLVISEQQIKQIIEELQNTLDHGMMFHKKNVRKPD